MRNVECGLRNEIKTVAVGISHGYMRLLIVSIEHSAFRIPHSRHLGGLPSPFLAEGGQGGPQGVEQLFVVNVVG